MEDLLSLENVIIVNSHCLKTQTKCLNGVGVSCIYLIYT